MLLERNSDIMDLNMFALMYENGLIDSNLNVIPNCPICDRPLVKTRDSVYSYYCNNCNKSFTADLRRCKNHSSHPHIRIFKRDSKKS